MKEIDVMKNPDISGGTAPPDSYIPWPGPSDPVEPFPPPPEPWTDPAQQS